MLSACFSENKPKAETFHYPVVEPPAYILKATGSATSKKNVFLDIINHTTL
ncbi:hypothetical protein FHS90_001203 [Rufibacter quisquiliarum]|uniref:Uncharacterized protein n=1 Tax=Rufibacter quisquiliarum TaxID=1549639 RepID=A0A839GNK2_9BACT|nr:hypothetical protein [Rufibacter quisquiliarum]